MEKFKQKKMCQLNIFNMKTFFRALSVRAKVESFSAPPHKIYD